MSIETRNLTIAAFDADNDDAVDASFRIDAAARAHDVPDFPPPCRHRHAALVHHPYPGSTHSRFLALLNGEPVGSLDIELSTLDNFDNAPVGLIVHPAHRRRGIGRALFDKAVEVARADGRRRLMSQTVEQLAGGPDREGAGAKFAAALGAHAALHEVRRRLEVSHVDTETLDRVLAGAYAKAAGYSLVQWRDRVPDGYLDDFAYLDSRMVTDAPMGDLVWEAQNIDAEHIRRVDEARARHGSRQYATGMRNDATGHLVAISALTFFKTVPEHAWQGITLVHAADRGHRLGTIVKIENLRYAMAHESALAVIDTWNAGVNSYMISINEAVGFRPVDAWVNWQLEI
jgi:GNAT superfamily N-acetyltransferase